MALPTASDNIFPKLILDEAGTLGTVASGQRRIGVDANGVLVWKDSGGTTSPLVALNKWDATTAPTANEDSGDGYQVGSRWVDVTNDKEYVCLDATSTAAVWTETTAAGGSSTHVGARVFNSANIALTATSETILTFDSESWDTNNFHSTVSATDRLVIPSGQGGKYRVWAQVRTTASPGASYVAITLNGTTVIAAASLVDSALLPAVALSTEYDLAVADYVTFSVRVANASKNATFNAGHSPVFGLTKVG